MPADDYVGTVGRRRRQPVFQFLRTRPHLFSESGRQRPANPQLPFQTGRQTVALGKARRQVIAAIVVPATHLVPVAITVIMIIIIVAAVLAAAVVCDRDSRQGENQQRACEEATS